jgi:type II restriction enzyme
MNFQNYQSVLGLASLEETINMFHNTIIDTNRGYKFFVDWNKVRKNVEKYKIEFNILNSLIGSRNFDGDLRNLLKKYPEILPVVPILLAIRDIKLKVIKDFLDGTNDIVEYEFKNRKLSTEEIQSFIEFFSKTGLRRFFEELSTKSIQDYVTGVEVGMDTHARKNRSGDAMEIALKPIIEQINSKQQKKFTVLFQKKFEHLEKTYDIKVSSSIRNRKADFIILKDDNKKIVNIEVNFFSGTGSKPQEIVDAYINRQNDLKANGIDFIWVTDGDGWKGQKNQIKKGFEEVNFVLNLHFVRKGLLEDILCKI